MKKRAFALVRVSSSEQDTESQKNSLIKIAKDSGYDIAPNDIFEEQISGYDEDETHDRLSIIKLEEQISIRKPDAIFVWELSRLTRRAIKVQRYIDRLSIVPKVPMYFADYDVWTLDVKTLRTLDDNIMMLVGGAKSVELERERIKARTSRGRNAKAEQGFFVGHLADGYTWEFQGGEKVIIKDDARAELIQSIYEMYVDKEYSTGMIRDTLNADIEKYPPTNRYRRANSEKFRGYKVEYKDRSGNLYSRDDLLWSDASISQILRDEWYKGVRYYHNQPYPVPPIIEEDMWNKAQERLDSFRFISNPTTRKYLLTGKLYCGICGRKLYGHGDDYSNMYYCSSQEYGKQYKCGLRWIRKENLEAIVFNLVRKRATEDTIVGEKSVFSDFFETDKARAKEIDNKIRTHNKIIRRAEDEKSELNKRLSFLIQQQAKHYDNINVVNEFDKQIRDVQAKIDDDEKLKRTHQIEIDKLKKQKKLLMSVKEKLAKITEMDDFDNMRELLLSVIDRITIFNPDKTSSVIKINYVNGESDYAIYNPTRLKRRYIFLSEDYMSWMKMSYEEKQGMLSFNGHYLAIGDNMTYVFDWNPDEEIEEAEKPFITSDEDGIHYFFGKFDTESNRKLIQKEIDSAIDRGDIDMTETKQIWEAYEFAISEGVVLKSPGELTDMVVAKDSMSVIDFVNAKRGRGETLNVYAYDDLLPMTERGMKRKKWHQEYQKKYNTGSPTFTPYVEKGTDYEDICLKRKHLYNRKYKILHNKHLSDAEKEKQIMEIMEKLEAYKYQVKYLPNNKKGEMLKKKYNAEK